MDSFVYCRIRIKGHLLSQWTAWFGELEIENRPDGQAVLLGRLPDQAALYGVLIRMRDLGLHLVSVNCVQASSRAFRGNGPPSDSKNGTC